jgi:hypothetical protein
MSWMAKITTSLEERLGLWWHPATWLGHSLVMAAMVLLAGDMGFWVVAFYYTTREAGQFGGAAPWWDSVMDVLAPVAVGLLLNVAL